MGSDVDSPPVLDDAPTIEESDDDDGPRGMDEAPYSIELPVYSVTDPEEYVDDSVVRVPPFSAVDEGEYPGNEDSGELDEVLVRVTG